MQAIKSLGALLTLCVLAGCVAGQTVGAARDVVAQDISDCSRYPARC